MRSSFLLSAPPAPVESHAMSQHHSSSPFALPASMLAALFFALVLAVFPASAASAADGTDVRFRDDVLVIDNSLMSQQIVFKGNMVVPVSIICKKSGKELLSVSKAAPWFEFVINGKLVSATEPLWEYGGHTTVALANDGTEVRIRILGRDALKGLVVEIQKQFFPDSTLTRERLLLTADAGSTFRLNKLDGKLHFRFPRYQFSALLDGTDGLPVREQRIATWDNEPFPDFNKNATWDQRAPRNLATLHAFSPVAINNKLLVGETTRIKGPFQIIQTKNYSLLTAYEHASQDSRRSFKLKQKQEQEKETLRVNGRLVNDEQLGSSGESDLDFDDESLRFLEIETRRGVTAFDVSVNIVRGGYFDNELIKNTPAYETVWSAFSFYENESQTKAIIHRYLTQQITTHKLSRVPRFYYNTWGMQRTARSLRDSFTEQRIIEEATYAAQSGAEVFVMDDGWQEMMGVWTPKKELKNGIKPIVEAIKKEGMVPGIWVCPLGLDVPAKLAKEHPEWLIKDKNGKPIKASWNIYFLDFVGDYYSQFTDNCKKLIDEGILFFKWDGIDSYPCSLAGQHHGGENETPQERKNRYDYLLPFYITRSMRELREYNPNVVIEIDVTEAERSLIGLMPLQEGKLFWMNNGASGYGDYTSFRTKSMRTVANRYDGVLPSDIFTYAVYPQNVWPTYSQRHNVNTALVAGHGIWGNLKELR
ncbi:MAG: alpha-galactosidase, partial [Puniceicoccales bacterium]|nr:alpha-galactosidase [Puniceicoccales bacterium]